MDKKKYIYLTTMIGVVIFVSYFFIRDVRMWAMITHLLLGIFFIYNIHRIFYYLKKAIIY